MKKYPEVWEITSKNTGAKLRLWMDMSSWVGDTKEGASAYLSLERLKDTTPEFEQMIKNEAERILKIEKEDAEQNGLE